MKKREDQEQETVIQWSETVRRRYPGVDRIYHIPNGGKRNAAEAAHFKRLGVKPGVPDLCLPVARRGYHGLYVEMKSKKGKTTEKQDEWLEHLSSEGYLTAVCFSAEQAIKVIEDYLRKDD